MPLPTRTYFPRQEDQNDHHNHPIRPARAQTRRHTLSREEFAPTAELQDARFQKQPWRQNTTPDAQTGDIKVNPVQMVTTPKPMFFENQEGAFVTVKGSYIDGKLSAVETENTRGHLFLNTFFSVTQMFSLSGKKNIHISKKITQHG